MDALKETSIAEDEVVMSAKGITKVYPGTVALKKMDFDIYKGKVNVLIGENGAGKSTLMKILAGIEQPTEGSIYLHGQKITLNNTREATEKGIGIIHQELNLFPNLTIYQNIFVGQEHTKNRIHLDNRQHLEKAKAILQRLEHPLNPHSYVSELKVGQQQIVEIAKTMVLQDLHVLIMDEPTSALSGAEVEVLFRLVQELKQQGVAIIYISHRMEEILKIGDYITILRDGHLVAKAKVKDVNLSWIVRKMVGYEKTEYIRKTNKKIGKEILKVNQLTLPRKGIGYHLKDVSFTLKKGEILGVFGLLGAGRTELLESLMGIRPEADADIILNGKPIKPRSVRKQIEQGFAYIPEDRQREGLVQTLSIAKNLVLSSFWNITKGFHILRNEEKRHVSNMIKDLFIKVADPQLPILSLSGGNQQKVVIGKGILTNPQILLLDEPTRGIDVGAKADIFELINQFAEKGLAIIFVSSELKEIVGLADRVIVLSNGEITGEFAGEEITEEALMNASTIQLDK